MELEGHQPDGWRITVSPRSTALRVFLTLLCVEVVLVALDVLLNRSRVVPYRAFRRLFNIAYDNSIAGWFSAGQALVTASLAGAIAFLRGRRGFPGEARGWVLVGLFFLYLSADDGAKIHERIGTTFDNAASSGAFSLFESYPSYTWQVTVGPLLLGGFLMAALFLWRRLREFGLHRLLFAVAGCLAAAVAIDVAEGAPDVYKNIAVATGLRYSFVSHYLRAAEEFLEMAGMSVLLALLLTVLFGSADGLTFRASRD